MQDLIILYWCLYDVRIISNETAYFSLKLHVFRLNVRTPLAQQMIVWLDHLHMRQNLKLHVPNYALNTIEASIQLPFDIKMLLNMHLKMQCFYLRSVCSGETNRHTSVHLFHPIQLARFIYKLWTKNRQIWKAQCHLLILKWPAITAQLHAQLCIVRF